VDDFIIKVKKIAEHKYEIDEVVLEEYQEFIERCYDNNFTPIRTVEAIAKHLYE